MERVSVIITVGESSPRHFLVHPWIIEEMGDDPAWFILDSALAELAPYDKQ